MKFLENRIPPPVIASTIAVIMWGVSFVPPIINISQNLQLLVSVFIVVLGVFFCIAGLISFRLAKTTVNPLKPETASYLVIVGIYRVSRNPMYLGFAIILLAWAVYLSSIWAWVGIPAFVHYMNQFQIIPEERALSKIFTNDFMNYCSNVRRWL